MQRERERWGAVMRRGWGGSEIEVEIQIREQQSGGREQEAWKEHVVLILPEKKKWHEPFLHRSFKFCE